VDIYFSLMGFFIKGGVFMAPIAIVGALAAAIAIERYITITRLVVTNRRVWEDVEPSLSNGEFDVAREKTSKSDTIVARLLGVGLARLGAVRRIEDMEKALRANLMEVIPYLEKRTHYLATFANLATLLGLLGTVSGLIRVFASITETGLGDPTLLAGGISEALVATFAGLAIAIPSLIAYRYYRGRVTELVLRIEQEVIRLVDALHVQDARARGDGKR
jgi:biopolymer transport protein ExbB